MSYEYFDRDHIKSVDCFGKCGHFNNILPIQEHGMLFYFFESYFISFMTICFSLSYGYGHV